MDNSDFHFPLSIAEISSLALCFDNATGRPGELKPRPVTTTSSSVVLAGLGSLSDDLAGLGGSQLDLMDQLTGLLDYYPQFQQACRLLEVPDYQ